MLPKKALWFLFATLLCLVACGRGDDQPPRTTRLALVPVFSSLSPTSGPAGTPVVITGSGFTGTTLVAFSDRPGPEISGGTPALFNVDSDAQITAIVPPGSTAGPIVIRNIDGETWTSPFTVTSTAAPTISAFNPLSGGPGVAVTVTGSAFTGATNVSFNGISASFALVDDGTLVADVPLDATTGLISVTNTVGTGASASSFVMIPPPVIDGFSPQSGAPGAFITVTGTGFTGATEVRFGMSAASSLFQVNSAVEIVAQVPAGAASGPIFVMTPGGSDASSMTFTVLSLVAPTISGFSPMTGGVDSFTRISGSNFTGVSSVSFNGTPSSQFYIEGDSTIAAYVPGGATTGPITVTNNVGSATSTDVFTVIPPPWIAGFTPTAGAAGDTVVITGGGFTGTYAVYVGWGAPAAVFTVDGDAQITATVPPGAVTGRIRVEAPGGMVESPATFTVLASAPPTVSSFNPGSGSMDQNVMVYGSGFAGTTSVTFGGVTASFNLRSASELEAWVPFGAASGPIAVTNSLGTGSSATSFIVIPPPVITGFAPSSGQPGVSVVITGSAFTGATDVIFGGGQGELQPRPGGGGSGTSASFTVDSDGQITAVVPFGAQSGTIAVRTPGGWTESLGVFTVLSAAPPVIQAFSPTSGGEGRSVAITGSGFTGTTGVVFNGVPASFSLLSDTEISTYVPNGATTGPIAVTNTLGTAMSSSNFTVIPPPVISGFSPSSGETGVAIVITGSGFTGATEVVFGTTRESSPGGQSGSGQAVFSVDSDTQITAIVPAGSESGPISVRTPGGYAESSQWFTVLASAPPVLTSFSPTGGGERSSVRLIGSGFTGTTDVSFAGTPASFSLLSDGEIMAIVPVGATTGPISVTNTLGTATSATSFTVYPPPSIAGFSPGTGAAGTTVVITGAGFTGANGVAFATSIYMGSGSGGAEAPRPGGQGAGGAVFTVDSDAQITVIVPAGTVTGPIEVMTEWGYATSATSFIVESSSAPSIVGFTPTIGGRGTAVTLWGSGLTGTTSVAFGGIAATSFSLNGDGSLTAFVPEGALTGPLSVTNTIGTATSAQSFTVIPPPTVASFSPTTGQPGTTVVLTGSGFLAARDVWFGGGAGASFVVDSDAQISAVVPNGAQSGPISVWTPYGSGQSSMGFTVQSTSPPTVAAFSPSSGMPGTRVTVTGSGFSGVTSVLFNGMGAWGFNVLADTALEAVVPTGATTGPITVQNTLGSAVSATDFVVLPGPTVTGFSPLSGEAGDSVVITGSGFTDVEMIRFGGAWASFTVESDSQITATVPNGAVTGPIEVAGTLSTEIFTVLSSGPPMITGFSPTSGSVGSFTRLTGTNFTGITEVLFNGTQATSFGLESGGSLYAYVPPGATTGPITVTNTLGSANSSTDFTIVPPPTLSGFTPPNGSPGDTVVLTGMGFSGVSSVRFGGGNGASFVVDSDMQITATVPIGAVTGPIELNNSVQSATDFVVLSMSAPVIGGFSPGSGGAGAEVTISGFGFAGAIAVSFGGVPAWFEARSDLTLVARVPLGAATGPITVANNVDTATSATNFVILPPPTVSAFYPSSGAAGDTIVITGTGFTGATRVEFGSIGAIEASFTVIDDTQISATVPMGAITGPISVEAPTGTATSTTNFTVVGAVPPTIVSFDPPSGGVGLIVHLTGAGFTGTTGVSFGGVAAAAFAARSDTELDAAVPLGAVTAPITVVNAAGSATSSTDFIVEASGMWITDVSPPAGAVGTAVAITGTNLGGSQVQFSDGVQATVLVDTSTSLAVTVPAGAKSGWIVVYRDPDGQNGPDEVAIWPLFTVYTSACSNAPAGTPCGLCAVCDSTGACAAPAADDSGCGTIDCDALDQSCGNYHDLVAGRCEGAGDCKDANTADCTVLSAASAGTDCGTCSRCNGQGSCADDLAQDGDCPACQECAAGGACSPQANGTACDDGNACTTADVCQAGACSGANPIVCSALDACHVAGVCDPATGTCSNPPVADGTACDDGRLCTSSDACWLGACTPSVIACECTTDADCFPLDQCHVAGTCDPISGRCTHPSAPDGTPCNDANACTTGETCRSGACGGPTGAIACIAASPCHDVGVCDPSSGICSSPAKPNGSLCNDGLACTQGDSCQSGTCVPTTNLCTCATDADCVPLDQCHVAGTCDPVTHRCSTPAAPNGTPCDDANACTTGETCLSGDCGPPTSVVTCAPTDACHAAGSCDPATGACSNPSAPDGTPCDDGRSCTGADACEAGMCLPGPSSCACSTDADCFPIDQCHVAGTCNVSTGQCSNPPAIDGRACSDGDACTSGETCQAGICGAPIATVSCTALDECRDAGVCDSATGLCTNPAIANGTLCDDGTACTQGDSCQAGACVPSSDLCPCATDADCPARDQCHVAGTCDTVTRLCTSAPAPDSTPCDDANACTSGETCQAGSCSAPSSTVVCAPPGECEEPGVCNPATGACSFSPQPDRTPCVGGECQAGLCTPILGVGTGADGGGPDDASPDGGASGSGGTAAVLDGSNRSDAGSVTAGTTGAGGAPDGATSMPGDADSDAGEASPNRASGDDSGCGCRLTRAPNTSASDNLWLLFTASTLMLRGGTSRRRRRAVRRGTSIVSPFERR